MSQVFGNIKTINVWDLPDNLQSFAWDTAEDHQHSYGYVHYGNNNENELDFWLIEQGCSVDEAVAIFLR